MNNEDYGNLTLDELVDVFRAACEKDDPGPDQHAAVARINAIRAEMLKRDGAMDRFRALLKDPSEYVRYAAALDVQWVDPKTAYAVFEDLENALYVSGRALMAKFQMRHEGRI